MNCKYFCAGFLFLFVMFSNSFSQTCGFGCLGLGGFYAGYNFQQYNAPGFNYLVAEFNKQPTVTQKMDTFGKTSGFRVGANILRTKYKSILVSVKGFYQFLKEDNRAYEIISDKERKTTYSLKLDYWGAGFDAGFSVFDFMDFKVVDAQIIFQKIKIEESLNPEPANYSELRLNSIKTGVGYSIASGLIFKIVGDYISFETSAGYTQMKLTEMENENDLPFILPGDQKEFISTGGFNAVFQLNVGIPLY